MTKEAAVRSIISNIPAGFPFELIFDFEVKFNGLYVKIAAVPNATMILSSLHVGLSQVIDFKSTPPNYYLWKLYGGFDAQERLEKIQVLLSMQGDDDP